MGRPLTAVVLSIVTAAGVALAQTPSSSEEVSTAAIRSMFAAYHAELDRAADNALADIVQRIADASGDEYGKTLLHSPESLVHAFDQQYRPTAIPGVSGALRRMNQLRPIVEPVLQSEGIPPELASVVAVESGGRPNALSPQGALGLWQLMPDTARRYGLAVSASTDERLNVERSTRAAARYLRDLYQQFGSWPLALAGYNAGEKALQRAVTRGGTSDFLQLSKLRLLPPETRNYVPAALSVMRLLGHGQLPDPSMSTTKNPPPEPVFAVPDGQP
jgi:hypothetical protein